LSSLFAAWAPAAENTPDLPGDAAQAATAAVGAVADPDASYDDLAVLTEAILLVQRNAVEAHQFRDLIYHAVDGMLTSLDPHSAFLTPEAFESLREETAGQFSGIGITIGVRQGTVVVIAPIEGSPAFRAGVRAGDRIVAVDGQPLRGVSLNEAVKKMRGPRDTTVRITIERNERDPELDGQPIELTITRAEVRVASVRGGKIVRDGVGYIRINQFNEQTPAEFEKAFRSVLDLKATALVLDLRDNPGGLLDSAVAVAEKFLPGKAVIVSTRGREGARVEEQFRAGGSLRDTAMPMAVLMNRGSASASEIVAGAIQDHRRGIVVGETSFGKASVQNIVALRLRPDCAVRLTTAHYFTPEGRLIHGKGIVPDIVVPQSAMEWRQVQLKRLYEESPDAYPMHERAAIDENLTDMPLDRAIDVLIGVRLLGGKK
jgi:carboxyl-terminal processing protease